MSIAWFHGSMGNCLTIRCTISPCAFVPLREPVDVLSPTSPPCSFVCQREPVNGTTMFTIQVVVE